MYSRWMGRNGSSGLKGKKEIKNDNNTVIDMRATMGFSRIPVFCPYVTNYLIRRIVVLEPRRADY